MNGDASQPFIVPSTTPSGAVDEALVGGKGWNLLRLREAGFQVPPWWVVTSALFDTATRPLRDGIDAILDDTDFTDAAAVESASVRIGEILHGVTLPEDFLRALSAAVGDDDSHFAVRSSVRGEDSATHSFAGLMDSFLNRRAEELPEMIRQVWMSAYSPRALSYRWQTGIGAANISAAVVIQEMIPAASGGVMFTRDPNTRRKTCIISAASGLGEGVTSDLVGTDTYRIDWDSDMAEKHIARKTRRIVSRSDSDILVEAMAPDAQQEPVLSDGRVRHLRDIAVQAETLYGLPLDMEWAFDPDGTCWVLQARPIVFRATTASIRIWDNANIIESYPGLTQPLTFSFARELYKRVFRGLALSIFRFRDARWKQLLIFEDLFGLIQGRVYLNLLNWYQMLSYLPGFEQRKKAWDRMFGIGEEIELPAIPKTPLDTLCIVWFVAAALLTVRGTKRRFRSWFERLYAGYTGRPLVNMDAAELIGCYQHFIAEVTERWHLTLRNDFCAMTYYDWLQKLCRRWAPADHPNLHNDLLRGQTGVESIAPSRSIDRLASLVRSKTEYRALFDDPDDGAIWAKIQNDAPYAAVKEGVNRHLADYGDRSVEELKLEIPSFREEPERLVGLIRDRLDAGASIGEVESNARTARLESEAVIRARIRNPLKRTLLRFVLRNARDALANRESMRLARGRVYGFVRQIFERIGEQFEREGLLRSRRDIFYLTVGEIADFVHGTAITQNLATIIDQRRKEYEDYASRSLPGRFQTMGTIYRSIPLANIQAVTPGQSVSGIGCASGIATGTARIIRDPAKVSIGPGEIIVAHSTDPAWVFLMTSCAGIVVERGSVLSHTAIIGRELGIPTIVGVPEATERIPDGATITIDGQSGQIQWE